MLLKKSGFDSLRRTNVCREGDNGTQPRVKSGHGRTTLGPATKNEPLWKSGALEFGHFNDLIVSLLLLPTGLGMRKRAVAAVKGMRVGYFQK
jgi:hypothetical protein